MEASSIVSTNDHETGVPSSGLPASYAFHSISTPFNSTYQFYILLCVCVCVFLSIIVLYDRRIYGTSQCGASCNLCGTLVTPCMLLLFGGARPRLGCSCQQRFRCRNAIFVSNVLVLVVTAVMVTYMYIIG